MIQLINEKISNIKDAAASWSWIERILTANALRKMLIQVKQIQESAGNAMKKLEVLPKSLEGIQA